MCFNKFNLTSEKRSTAIVTVKHHCVMSCIAPNVIEVISNDQGFWLEFFAIFSTLYTINSHFRRFFHKWAD